MKRKTYFIPIILGIFIVLIISTITWSVCHNDSPCENLRQDLISGYKWAKSPYDVIVSYWINTSVDPTGTIIADTNAAADIWTKARYPDPPSNPKDPKFRLSWAGTTSNTPGVEDNKNVVGFDPIDGPGGKAAETTNWYSLSNPKVIIEADIEYDNYDTWQAHGQNIQDAICLRDVASHEFGHFVLLNDLGAGQCPDYGRYTMHGSAPANWHGREDLECEDIYGLWYTYQGGEFPYAPPLFASHKHPNIHHKAPRTTILHQNVPNPANPETWIPFELSQDADANIRIYNSKGQLIRTLRLGHKEAGYYIEKSKAAYWDGKNEAGERVASGVYFYQLQAGSFISNRKMVILK